jgi:enamine deaminase RidA (YjgF/YER057c/UK114 family)
MSIEARIAELGLQLPAAAAPVASYVPTVEADNMLYVSGQISFAADGSLITGRLGADMDVAAGQAAAERCALMILAQVKAALGGSFGRVERVVKLGVFVQCTPEFTQQPEVANGASDLFVKVFGEAGKHARAAVGVPALPRGVAVEVDAVLQLR